MTQPELSSYRTGHMPQQIKLGRVILHVRDLAQLPYALKEDPRLSGMPLTLIDGDLDNLIANLARSEIKPDCLMIELSDDQGAIFASLNTLADALPSYTRVYAYGLINDVDFYRTLIELGIQDYFVGWPTLEQVIEINRQSHQGSDDLPGRILGLYGIAGGVGTSTIAFNLSAYFAHRIDQPVSLIDAGDTMSGLRHLLHNRHFEKARPVDGYDFKDVEIDVFYNTNAKGRFRLTLSQSTDSPDQPDLDHQLVSLIEQRRRQGEVVLLDMPAIGSRSGLFDLCDDILLIGEPDFKCLALAHPKISFLKSNYPFASLHLALTKLEAHRRIEFDAETFRQRTGLDPIFLYRCDHQIVTNAWADGAPFLPISLLHTENVFAKFLQDLGLKTKKIEAPATWQAYFMNWLNTIRERAGL